MLISISEFFLWLPQFFITRLSKHTNLFVQLLFPTFADDIDDFLRFLTVNITQVLRSQHGNNSSKSQLACGQDCIWSRTWCGELLFVHSSDQRHFCPIDWFELLRSLFWRISFPFDMFVLSVSWVKLVRAYVWSLLLNLEISVFTKISGRADPVLELRDSFIDGVLNFTLKVFEAILAAFEAIQHF